MENWNKRIMVIVDNIAAGAFQVIMDTSLIICGVFAFTVIGNGLLELYNWYNWYEIAFAVIGIILFGFISHWVGKKENEKYKRI